ncbi:hypothetical protein ATANTOWER_029800 [Ataeniobius toweri]|uniref:Uncharacterized protein n=1 Tax=Ataeniobius toweri TaxID=208326 RepID=A0ABU7AIE0_9TELE|nr:hypothetical protein [Ataeniobius toweri]
MIRKEKGSLSPPNLCVYYLAAQLKTVIQWCENTCEAKWKEMENICGTISIQALIGEQKLATACERNLNRLASFTLMTWFEMVRELKLSNQIQILSWLLLTLTLPPTSWTQLLKFGYIKE